LISKIQIYYVQKDFLFYLLFKTDIKRDQVVKVWIAEKSNIALIKNDTWQEDGFGYEILAEPNY